MMELGHLKIARHPCKCAEPRNSIVRLHHLAPIRIRRGGLLGIGARGRLFLLGLVLLLPLRLAAITARLHVVPTALPHLAPREGPLAHLAKLRRQILFLHPSRHSSES